MLEFSPMQLRSSLVSPELTPTWPVVLSRLIPHRRFIFLARILCCLPFIAHSSWVISGPVARLDIIIRLKFIA